MSLLTDADLTFMRDTIEEMFPDTCSILSETLLSDGQGGVSSSWGTVSSKVPCRLDDKPAALNQLPFVAGGEKEAHQYQLSLASSATITAGDMVELNSLTYHVVSVNINQSWRAVSRAVVELTGNAPGTVSPLTYYTVGSSPIA